MTYQTQARRVIPILAPPAPKCFDARDVWVSYLQSAQSVPRASERPFLGERYRPTFNFCKECPAHHREQREAEGRCDFDAYVARVRADMEEPSAATCP